MKLASIGRILSVHFPYYSHSENIFYIRRRDKMLEKKATYRARNSVYTVPYLVKMEPAFLLFPFEWRMPLSLSTLRITQSFIKVD